MPLSDSSQTYMRAVWPMPSPADLRLASPAGVSEVSRFSCMKFLGVPGVFDYARLSRNSRYRSHSCCLPPLQERRRLDCIFSELNTHPTYSPVYASSCTSRCPTQNSGSSGSLVPSRKASSASASCRFNPTHCNRDFGTAEQNQLPSSTSATDSSRRQIASPGAPSASMPSVAGAGVCVLMLAGVG
jgi:hypothetical protein